MKPKESPQDSIVTDALTSPYAMIGNTEKLEELGMQGRREFLRRFREYAGLSLDEVAKRSKLSKSMISKFELGHRDLSTKALRRLERTLARIAQANVNQFAPDDVAYLGYLHNVEDWDLDDLHSLHVGLTLSKDTREELALCREMARMLADRHPDAVIVKKWYEAELAASTLRDRLRNYDSRFRAEMGRHIAKKFLGKAIERVKRKKAE